MLEADNQDLLVAPYAFRCMLELRHVFQQAFYESLADLTGRGMSQPGGWAAAEHHTGNFEKSQARTNCTKNSENIFKKGEA